MEKPKPIGGGLAFVLIAIALMVDGLQALLTLLVVGIIINPLLNILVGITFTIMLSSHGGGLIRRRAISMTLTTIGEFIPVVNALPVWTAFALYTVFMDRITHAVSKDSPQPAQPRSRGWRL